MSLSDRFSQLSTSQKPLRNASRNAPNRQIFISGNNGNRNLVNRKNGNKNNRQRGMKPPLNSYRKQGRKITGRDGKFNRNNLGGKKKKNFRGGKKNKTITNEELDKGLNTYMNKTEGGGGGGGKANIISEIQALQ